MSTKNTYTPTWWGLWLAAVIVFGACCLYYGARNGHEKGVSEGYVTGYEVGVRDGSRAQIEGSVRILHNLCKTQQKFSISAENPEIYVCVPYSPSVQEMIVPNDARQREASIVVDL